jgi:protein involved in polysaccharide export with SLBB domain
MNNPGHEDLARRKGTLVSRSQTKADKPKRRARHAYLSCIAVLLTALALVTTACSPGASLVSDHDLGTSTGTSQAIEIRIEAGDKLKVTVFGEDKLSGDYQVNTAGYLSLPLAGSVKVSGMTGPELERALEQKFKGSYLRNPRVTVEVLTFRPFFILGEVQKPGEYPFRTGLNVLSAIAIAGGGTYRANTSKVMIQRSGSNEIREFPQSPSVSVMPGDLIRVPERYF